MMTDIRELIDVESLLRPQIEPENPRYMFAHKVNLPTSPPNFGGEGNCVWCGKPLTGRQRSYCAGEWRGDEHYRYKFQACLNSYYFYWYTVPCFKRAILIRDNFTCQACGLKPMREGGGDFLIPDIGELHCDHIVPLSKGGKTVLENLQTLCARCNLSKGAKRQHVATMPLPIK